MLHFQVLAYVILLAFNNVTGVSQCDTLFLKNDTTLCFGKTIVLNAGADYDSYLWNTGSIEQSIVTPEPGDY